MNLVVLDSYTESEGSLMTFIQSEAVIYSSSVKSVIVQFLHSLD